MKRTTVSLSFPVTAAPQTVKRVPLLTKTTIIKKKLNAASSKSSEDITKKSQPAKPPEGHEAKSKRIIIVNQDDSSSESDHSYKHQGNSAQKKARLAEGNEKPDRKYSSPRHVTERRTHYFIKSAFLSFLDSRKV